MKKNSDKERVSNGSTHSGRIFTIGYSNRAWDAFIELLKAHSIATVIDIRTIPKSRRCPQFNEEELKAHLKKNKIGYRRIKELGGLRHTSKDSVNTGWINPSFRGFADYMQTSAFQIGLKKLEKIAEKKCCVLLCAEGNPRRCHRSLIADALTVQKYKVFHIQSRKTAKLHALTPFLRISQGRLIYPASYFLPRIKNGKEESCISTEKATSRNNDCE